MNTKQLRQRVLDLAIHGRLVPQNPDDEPASVLLIRIKAEKERLVKEGKIKKNKGNNEPIDEVPFEVPEGWCWCRLGELCSKFSTGPFGSMVHKSDYVTHNGIPLVNPANIIDGTIIDDKIMLVSQDKANELVNYILEIDDIVLARRGDLSKCAIVDKEQKGWICGTGSFFLHLVYVYPKYFELFYSTDYLQKILTVQSVGATMDNLNQSLLNDVLIPLPPLAEQHRIVEAEEKWFSVIDLLESSENDLQKAITQAKSKILDLAINGKLVEKEGEWQEKTLGEVCDVVMGQSPAGESLNTNQDGIEFHQGKLYFGEKFLDISGVYTNAPLKYAVKHSIVMCVRAPVGIPNITERRICIGRGLCALNCHQSIDMMFVYFFLASQKIYYEGKATGTTFKAISGDIIRNTPIPLPPLAEQHRIVAKIEKLFAQLDRISEALQ